jgi:glycerol-3-phosphate dehydrogenase
MLEEMAAQELDVLVIGGGITGCGIAMDAAQRNLRVGLVEMQDFGAGTSSRSTKLIHGGLRYLKQGEIQLVREVGRERAILYRNAPHLVVPEWMLLPLVKGGTYGRLATSFGLLVYDRLAGVKPDERRRMLTKKETMEREPLLKEDGLKGSGLYVEYRTDDARLTLEVIKTAVSLGALAANYSRVGQFVYDEHGNVQGAYVHDEQSGHTYTIKARKVVNATGPWVDQLRKEDRSLYGKRLHLTKGVHIVVDSERFPLRQAVYFDVSDGRMVFAIPRDGKTYVGTTDTNYEGDIRRPCMSAEDRDYLLQAANNMFPLLNLKPEHVESHWAGLRPLIHEDGKSPSELSRKDEIFRSESGLITIAGGKLTGFRKMAERVVDLVGKELYGQTFPPCRTDKQVLTGGDIGSSASWDRFLQQKTAELTYKGLSHSQAHTLIHRYGSQVDQVLTYLSETPQKKILIGNRFVANGHHSSDRAAPDRSSVATGERSTAGPGESVQPIGEEALLKAEAMYAAAEEMAVTADDFLIRRTGAAYFDRPAYDRYIDVVRQWLKEQ